MAQNKLKRSDTNTNTGTGDAFVFQTSPTINTASLGSSTATTQSPGDNSTKLATTAYVQAAIFDVTVIAAAKYATTGALPAATYSNGASGVGATLTGVSLGALTVDGATPSVNDRILVKNQASTFQNGVYVVTVVGSVGAAYVLTRSADYNMSADIDLGDTIFISAGSTLATTTWTQNGTESPVIGTDPITFAQTAGPGSYTAGNGISIIGTSIAINTSVTVDKTTAQVLTNKDLTSGTNTFPDFPVSIGDAISGADGDRGLYTDSAGDLKDGDDFIFSETNGLMYMGSASPYRFGFGMNPEDSVITNGLVHFNKSDDWRFVHESATGFTIGHSWVFNNVEVAEFEIDDSVHQFEFATLGIWTFQWRVAGSIVANADTTGFDFVDNIRIDGSTSGKIKLQATAVTGTNTLTLPAATDTLVGKATTDTLTNKTIASSSDVLGGVTLTLGSDASFDTYYRSSGGILTRLANGTTGQFLGANTGAAPTWQSPGGGGITWSEVTGTTQSGAVNTGYILNNASLVTLTLPSTAAVGSVIYVAGKGAGGWRIAQNASGIIHFGSSNTTTGTGGRLDSTNRYDSIQLVCIVANNEWVVMNVQGNITIT